MILHISGQRRYILFQYEMGTSEAQIDQMIDNLLNDWAEIVYLYYLVHDFSEQSKTGTLIFLLIINIFLLNQILFFFFAHLPF